MQVKAEKFQCILLLGLVCLTVLVGRGILFSGIWQTDNQKSPGFILDITSDTMRGVLETGWLLGFFTGHGETVFWIPPYTCKLYTLFILMKKLINFLIKYHSTALQMMDCQALDKRQAWCWWELAVVFAGFCYFTSGSEMAGTVSKERCWIGFSSPFPFLRRFMVQPNIKDFGINIEA